MKTVLKKYALILIGKKSKKLLWSLAVSVVFVTTYALILPAITLEQEVAQETPGIEVGSSPNSSSQSQVTQDQSAESQVQVNPDERGEDSSATSPSVAESEEIVEPEWIDQETEILHEGADYQLKLSFDGSARLPKGVQLKVEELEPGSSDYQHHHNQARASLGGLEPSLARYFDISFRYQGEEVEPEAPVKVVFSPHQAIENSDSDTLVAVHFKEDSSSELIAVQAKVNQTQVKEAHFEAESFSVYGLLQVDRSQFRRVAVAGNDYYDVKFYRTTEANQEEVLTSLIGVEAGAKIGTLPDPPFKQGYRFDGWRDRATGQMVTAETPVTADMAIEPVFSSVSIYTIEVDYFFRSKGLNRDLVFDKEIIQIEASEAPYRFDPPASTQVKKEQDSSLTADATYYPKQAVIEISEADLLAKDREDGTEDRKLKLRLEYVPYTAEYEIRYMLKDLTGTGYTEMRRVQARGVLDVESRLQFLSFPYAEVEEGQATSVVINQAKGQVVEIKYKRKEFTLFYNSNGGEDIDSQNALYGSQIDLSQTKPTRAGYVFDGWFTHNSLDERYRVNGKVTLNDHMTLYAKWTPQDVPYTVVYYREVYDKETGGTNFVYETSKSKTAKAGSTVSANQAEGISLIPAHAYELDTNQNATSSVTVAGDGSSILKVYYKLVRFTFIFNAGTSGEIAMNGQTYRNSSYRLTNLVLGQDLSNIWPFLPNEIYDRRGIQHFYRWNIGNTFFGTIQFEVTPDLISRANANKESTFTAAWHSAYTEAHAEYYLQSPDDPNKYIKSDLYSQTFNHVAAIGQKQINGYTGRRVPPGYPATQTIGGTRYYRFYYNLNRRAIEYSNAGVLETKSDIAYETNINTPTYNFVPHRPAHIDGDYTWGGWYTDNTFTDPYEFDTMPNSNVKLYAKWIAPIYEVSFDTQGGDSPTPPSQQVEKGRRAVAPTRPTKANHDFDGWYTSEIGGSRHNWTSGIQGPTKLYARWRARPLTYTIRYLDRADGSKLAEDKVETIDAAYLGQTLPAVAPAISRYRPDETSKSIVLGYGQNVITFYYDEKKEKVPYKVKYVLASDESIEIAPAVERTDSPGDTTRVKESAVKLDEAYIRRTYPDKADEILSRRYYPIEEVKSLVLSSNEASNVIVFKYQDYAVKTVTVNYLDMDGQPIPGQPALVESIHKSASFTLDRKSIPGYRLNRTEVDQTETDKTVFKIEDGGKLRIDLYYKKELTLRAQDKTKVYDGKVLASSGLGDLDQAYQANLVAGHQLTEISYTGSQTEVGNQESIPRAARIMAGNQDKTNYYSITYQVGNLDILPRPVTVRVEGQSLTTVYDGQSKIINYQLSIDDPAKLYREADIEIAKGTQKERTAKDAGQYSLDLQGRFSNKNPNFTVDFLVTDGQLLIQPRRLTLVSESADKAFDGTSLTADGVRVEVAKGASYSGFVAGEGASYTVTGQQTQPGSSDNSFTYQLNANTKAQNYDILGLEFGRLRVLPTIKIQQTDLAFQPLSGGKVALSRWDGQVWSDVTGISEIAIDKSQGIRLSEGLVAGFYRLEEKAAPDGYVVLEDAFYFKIDEGPNGDYSLQVTDSQGQAYNHPKFKVSAGSGDYSYHLQLANEPGRALPQTGGVGTKFHLLVGAGLIAVALLGAYARYRIVKGGKP